MSDYAQDSFSRKYLPAALILVSTLALGWTCWNIFSRPPTDWINPESPDVTGEEVRNQYLCTISGEKFELSRQSMTAPHPVTGQWTLVRALYCQECGDWVPAPPPEAMESMAIPRCRKHRIPLQPKP